MELLMDMGFLAPGRRDNKTVVMLNFILSMSEQFISIKQFKNPIKTQNTCVSGKSIFLTNRNSN